MFYLLIAVAIVIASIAGGLALPAAMTWWISRGMTAAAARALAEDSIKDELADKAA